jgi:hypothetical protein
LPKLLNYYQADKLEAGCDEAGRGCYAGPVFAAAVILPKDFYLRKIILTKSSLEILFQLGLLQQLHTLGFFLPR